KECWIMKLSNLLLTVAIALVAMPAGGAAQSDAPKPLVVTARNLTAEGETAGRDVAKPGDVIRYSLVFTNTTGDAVKNVQFVDPIPPGLVFVAGSAVADQSVRIEYSIDRGASYTTRPVVVETVNGRRVEKPAPAAMYTHIRWTVLGAVVPGAQVTAEFKARLAAPAESEKAPGEAN
ncbi:MAG: hypothetical protein ACREMV_14930, partial [Gemmatimonadales bacterium]